MHRERARRRRRRLATGPVAGALTLLIVLATAAVATAEIRSDTAPARTDAAGRAADGSPTSSSLASPGVSGTTSVTPPAANPATSAPAPEAVASPAPSAAQQAAALTARLAALTTDVQAIIDQAGVDAGVSLIDLHGSTPVTWSLDGDTQFTAASTYKLPLLMAEAQLIAEGKVSPDDSLCYNDSEYEAGWFDDYTAGECFTRQELAERVGQYSDNTAAHMLVADLGGGDALNAFASSAGASESTFWDPNVTTASDLARLWKTEAGGTLGGITAFQWLSSLLTNTAFEDGIPAGVGAGATVVHKIGWLDDVTNDAALVEGGPSGNYILTVTTSGNGGDGGWSVIAAISQRVWQFEQGY